MNSGCLTRGQIDEFQTSGVLVIRDFYQESEVEQVQHGIYEVIGKVYERHDLPDPRQPFAPDTFDSGYLDLIGLNRQYGGEIYDAIKQLPAFIRLVVNPRHDKLFRTLRPGAIPGVAGGGYGIRIDNPGEDKFRAMWHQEYPAQLRSLDGLVFWSPLVPITEELGPVTFCPGSQREGPLPVRKVDPEGAGREGAYALQLTNQDVLLAKYPNKIAPLTRPRDLVIIDFLVLHASGLNRGSRSRWSMQFRFFNFAERVGMSHGWKGSYAAGVSFVDIHPELLVQSPD